MISLQDVSVIICTYNPVQDIFQRCLSALAAANGFDLIREVIIVDNNSSKPLSQQEYIQKFVDDNVRVRVVQEFNQGLTPARLKGIQEAQGELLIFIDDDNLVNSDFFEKGVITAANYPFVGSWSGQISLEFEHEPEPWTRRYWGLLVYRQFEKDYWSNLPYLGETMPCGAGLFLRKKAAEHYLHLHKTGQRNIQLDRSGQSLFSGGDNDMAACACDIGLGVGLFHEIKLVHYIPSFRLQKAYLLKLAENIVASSIVLKHFRGEITHPPSKKTRVANIVRMMIKGPIDKEFFRAVLKGEKSGLSLISKIK